MRKKQFFVHFIISLSRCARHRNNNNNNEKPSPRLQVGADVCNCWFCWNGGTWHILWGQLQQVCAEDDSRVKAFLKQRKDSITVDMWLVGGEAGPQLWGRNYGEIFAFEMSPVRRSFWWKQRSASCSGEHTSATLPGCSAARPRAKRFFLILASSLGTFCKFSKQDPNGLININEGPPVWCHGVALPCLYSNKDEQTSHDHYFLFSTTFVE